MIQIDAATGYEWTFQEVFALARKIGQALFYEHGLRKGDIILLITPNCVEFLLVMLGTLTIGAVVSTANPSYTESEYFITQVLMCFLFDKQCLFFFRLFYLLLYVCFWQLKKYTLMMYQIDINFSMYELVRFIGEIKVHLEDCDAKFVFATSELAPKVLQATKSLTNNIKVQYIILYMYGQVFAIRNLVFAQ